MFLLGVYAYRMMNGSATVPYREHRYPLRVQESPVTRIDAAVTRVGAVEFTVVSVRPSATATTAEAERTIAGLTRYFPGRPIVLASKQANRIKYVGRSDLTCFLAKTEITRLPWRTYTFSN